MSKVICEREDIVAIADAIRNKAGTTNEMTLSGIVVGINSLQGGAYNTVYIGTNTPSNDIGIDGDIYIVRSEAV